MPKLHVIEFLNNLLIDWTVSSLWKRIAGVGNFLS